MSFIKSKNIKTTSLQHFLRKMSQGWDAGNSIKYINSILFTIKEWSCFSVHNTVKKTDIFEDYETNVISKTIILIKYMAKFKTINVLGPIV